MDFYEAISQEYSECLNYIHEAESYSTMETHRVYDFLVKIFHNPIFYSFINEIYGALSVKIYNDVIQNISYHIECPCEIIKKVLYSYGVPPYYDEIKITGLIRKYVLQNNFCLCTKINCQSKPPVPDIIWFQNI
jgi:hypothetical protein